MGPPAGCVLGVNQGAIQTFLALRAFIVVGAGLYERWRDLTDSTPITQEGSGAAVVFELSGVAAHFCADTFDEARAGWAACFALIAVEGNRGAETVVLAAPGWNILEGSRGFVTVAAPQNCYRADEDQDE
jgi:hypothetical protein